MMVFLDLFEALSQERAFDLLGDFLAIPALDEFGGRSAGSKAGNERVAFDVAQRILELTLDLLARDRHLEVFAARADLVDLDVQFQLSLRFVFPVGERLARGRRFLVQKAGGRFGIVVFAGTHRKRLPRAAPKGRGGRSSGVLLSCEKIKMEREMGFEPTTTTLATWCLYP